MPIILSPLFSSQPCHANCCIPRSSCWEPGMHCASCGSDNPPKAKFCIECGARLTRRCAKCGVENPPQAKFCAECGSAVTVAGQGRADVTAATQADTHSGEPSVSHGSENAERRHLTVLF